MSGVQLIDAGETRAGSLSDERRGVMGTLAGCHVLDRENGLGSDAAHDLHGQCSHNLRGVVQVALERVDRHQGEVTTLCVRFLRRIEGQFRAIKASRTGKIRMKKLRRKMKHCAAARLRAHGMVDQVVVNELLKLHALGLHVVIKRECKHVVLTLAESSVHHRRESTFLTTTFFITSA